MSKMCYTTMVSKEFSITSVFLWYFVTCFSVSLFLYGFFPLKSYSSNKVIDPPSDVNGMRVNAIDLYKAEVDRVVLVVIDALRMDFVNRVDMPFLTSYVEGENGCLVATKAESPTVTMPRIKAITTGCVPQFIDIGFNFASPKINEDSFLHRAKDIGMKMIFYGDDTWLKLFPDMFLRSEGTSSFYVSDYTEVDNNVTRHLATELKRQDWNILILHYLGLDHIGHLYGPFSPLIHKKLLEMDRIIQQIQSAVSKQRDRTLVLVCGDHGMRDSGGHGGSSAAETAVPLAVLGMRCGTGDPEQYTQQTDIAATLTTLLALPIPADSVGRVLLPLLQVLPNARLLYTLYYNAVVLIAKAPKINIDEFQDCFHLHKNYLMNMSNGSDAAKLYQEKLLKISEKLVRASSTQIITYLYISCSYLSIAFLSLLLSSRAKFNLFTIFLVSISFITESIFDCDVRYTCWLSIFLSCISWISARYELALAVKEFTRITPAEAFFLVGTAIATLMLASTSFIEEEHQTWYFLASTLVALGVRQNVHVLPRHAVWCVVLLVGVRTVRTLNQVGEQWSALPDVSDWLQHPGHEGWLWMAFALGLCGVWTSCHTLSGPGVTRWLATAVLITVLWRGVRPVEKVQSAQIAWALLTLTGLLAWRTCPHRAPPLLWLLWSALLMRPYNVVLLPMCYFASRCIIAMGLPLRTRVLAHLWLATVLHFCQGNCNSLASVDVSAGYVGLSNYSPIVIAVQTLCHTYTFPVLTQLLLLVDLDSKDRVIMMQMLTTYRTLNVFYFCIIILLHRNHLFIWSVFSPKLLIEASHTFVLFIFMMLCSLIKK